MSNWQPVAGIVQQFPDKEAMTTKEINGQIVRDFRVKSITSGKYVSVRAWPEYEDFEVHKGDFVVAEGPVQEVPGEATTYYNLTARSLVIIPALTKSEAGEAEAPKRAKAPKKPSF